MVLPRQERQDINLLFIVADQLRADVLSGRLAGSVPTPNLDRLAAQSLQLTDHHTVAVPCGPARASLFTGLYPSEHGATRNGVPLHTGLTNIAQELRRIGREPLLFGYTDTQPNPSTLFSRDPALLSYTGPMEGFTEVVEMREEAWRWLSYLRSCGYEVPDAGSDDFDQLYRPQTGELGGPALYDARHSDTAFLTDETIKALDIRKSKPWTAFLTYIRPHPPYVAPAPYHACIDPEKIPEPLSSACDHPFLQASYDYPSNAGIFWGYDGDARALDDRTIALVRATYLGLVAELDHHIGRLLEWLDNSGQADRTAIVFIADHGDMLGDFGLWGKLSPFPQASRVPFFATGPDIAAEKISGVSESTEVMTAVLRYLEGADLSFDAPAPGEFAKVEFSLSKPASPTVFERAGLVCPDTPGCVVFHNKEARIAVFEGEMDDLVMDPADGQPVTKFTQPA